MYYLYLYLLCSGSHTTSTGPLELRSNDAQAIQQIAEAVLTNINENCVAYRVLFIGFNCIF